MLMLWLTPIWIQKKVELEEVWSWTPFLISLVVGFGFYLFESDKKAKAERGLAEKRLTEELVPLLKARVEEFKSTGEVEFYNHDGIRNCGAVIWQDTNLKISSYKNVTTYTSVRSSYNTGSRTSKNKRGNRVNVGGTKGKREVIQEFVDLGVSNLYITTSGIRLCGDFDLDIPRSKLSSFRCSDYQIQINVTGKEFPVFITFSRFEDCQIAHIAMQGVL